jgi:tetratricopeptide (TPR) repeat protein
MRISRKREIFRVKSTPVDPEKLAPPVAAPDFIRRGLAYYARQQYDKAEADLRKATSMDADSVDAYYGLGMVLKAQRLKDGAVGAFQRAIELLEAGKIPDGARREMLRRLALGHVNELTLGDWNLEKEIWQRIG